jgi:hypothetical protein
MGYRLLPCGLWALQKNIVLPCNFSVDIVGAGVYVVCIGNQGREPMAKTSASTIDTAVRVQSITGQRGSDENEDRACRAASAVLRRRRVDATAAYEAFIAALDEGLDSDGEDFPRLARVWLEAESAACIAYTKGWRDPDGASVEIAPYWY